MSPTPWATPEQEAYLQTFYDQFLQCQAKRDYTTFWQLFFENWFEKFPERLAVFPNIPVNTVLTEDQKIVVAKAVEVRKDQLRNKLRNTLGNLLQSKEGRKQKPQKIEAYMSLYYEDKVHPMVDGAQTIGKDDAMAAAASQGSQASKLAPTLATIMSKTREVFKTESPNIMAKVDVKWKEMIAETEQKNEPKDKQHYIDRLAPTLAQFLTGFRELTSWSFSVLMGGPLPENGGKVEACSLHVGMTNLGSTFDQAYPEFNNGVMRPYKEFLDRVPALMTTGGTQELAPKSDLESAPPVSLNVPQPSLECRSACTSTSYNESAVTVHEGASWSTLDASAPPPLTLDPPAIAATPAALLPMMMPDDLLDSPVIAATPAALPPILPDNLLEIDSTSPSLTLDPLANDATPDTYVYNYCSQTTIDPLDQFLAKYPPQSLPQPHPLFPNMSTGTSNKLAEFEQIVAAASTQVGSLTCNDTTTPQTNITSVAPSAPSTLSEPPPSQPQLSVALPPSLVSTEGTCAVQTMAVTSTMQVINMATPQNGNAVAASESAPPTLSDAPTLQPQLPFATSQQNDPLHTDALSTTQSKATVPRPIQTASQGEGTVDVGSSSAQSAPVQPPPVDATPSSISPSMEGNGKRTRQPSKQNQVANSIGTDVSAPNKRSAANSTVKTRGAKYMSNRKHPAITE